MQIQGQIVDILNRKIYSGEITIENGKIIMSQNMFGINKNISFLFEEITMPNEKTQEKLEELLRGPYERCIQELFTPIEYTKLDLYPNK